MEGNLGNATPTTWHQLHWWKSPRWIVIRIEALAVVAIIISFFLAAFGSCRRWSNNWIVQKVFLAAQVLSLSLGTYSIGLMQSSSVKSEMYPIWTVSLFTLFGCIDPVTTYNGLDYKGPLSKVVYGICLNCGYVLLMSISTISNVIDNTAILTLSAISFIKGFHRSFALVQQNKMRDIVYALDNSHGEARLIRKKDESRSFGHMKYMLTVDLETSISHFDMQASIRKNKDKRLRSCYDVCAALCLSHRLQNHILGLDYCEPSPENLKDIDYKWALKVIEIELAFVYDAFFTGNPFLHYYQAKTASLWALASLIGTCFVLVATAIPEGLSRRSAARGGTKIVDTTTADLAITFGILLSLALLQLAQLVQSWTSNWARAAVAFAYARKKVEENRRMLFGDWRWEKTWKKAQKKRWALPGKIDWREEMKMMREHRSMFWSKQKERPSMRTRMLSGWIRLKVFVATSSNMFDKYLWQDKISQYSMLPEPRLLTRGEIKGERTPSSETTSAERKGELFSRDNNNGANLNDDVEASIPERISPSEKEGEGISTSEIEAERISSSSETSEIVSEGKPISSRIKEARMNRKKKKEARMNWPRFFSSLEMSKGVLKSERICSFERKGVPKRGRCVDLVQMLGLHYVWQVIWELLSSDSNKRGGVKLDEDVKGCVIDFLGQIQSDTLDRNWLSSLPEEPEVRHFLPYFEDPQLQAKPEALCYRYTTCVLTWHIATWYCELAEHKRQEDALMSKQAEVRIGCGRQTTASYYLRKAAAVIPRPSNYFQRRAGGGGGGMTRDHRRVANALSQYCVYLVKSAPELLPSPVSTTKRVYDRFAKLAKLIIKIEGSDKDTMLANMSDRVQCLDWNVIGASGCSVQNGQALAKLLMRRPDEIWKTLALVWVQLLVYAAPYGSPEAHRRHLSRGGEFITHLWALLYHLDIRQWKVKENLVQITTEEDAKRILAEESQAIVAFMWSRHDPLHDELVSASRLEDGVRYYYTLDDDIAEQHFGICYYRGARVVWLKQEADNHKFTFYEGKLRAYDIARFVAENIVALPHDQAHAQSSEDDGRQSEARIEEEIQPQP